MSFLEAASGLAVRHLKRDRIIALRARYLAFRTRLSPVMRAIYGTFDTAALREHLEQRIGTDFEILMVHSSINHMKPMYTDGALDLIRMLISFCGPDRTLAMPAFYFGDPAIGGAYETFKQSPRFDLRKTPSQMGLATELFRRWKGVSQSRHPAYRIAALGPLAEPLTVGHENAATACGAATPFEFMAVHNTRIIGIGKSVEVLTQAHHVEQLMGDDYPVPWQPEPALSITIVDGEQEIPMQFSGRNLLWRFNIHKLRTIMDEQELKEWKFHHVPFFSTRATDVTRALLDAAHRGVTLYDSP